MIKKTIVALGAASLVLLGGGLAGAQTAISATTTSNPQGDKLASSYASFAGSPANAQSLVNGLRTGSSITLGPSVTGPNANAPAASLPNGAGNSPKS